MLISKGCCPSVIATCVFAINYLKGVVVIVCYSQAIAQTILPHEAMFIIAILIIK